MKYLLVLLLLPSLAFAKDKLPDSAFQEAVLISVKTSSAGQTCSASNDTSTETSGNGSSQKTTGEQHCRDIAVTLYTVTSGNNTLILYAEPRAWNRPNVLHGILPGTHILIYSNHKAVHVRVGKEESKFQILEAR